MNFSKKYKSTVTPQFSPCGTLISTCNGAKIFIRDVTSLKLVQMWVCYGVVRDLAWSPDSSYLMSVTGHRIQIWSLTDPAWRSSLDENNGGIERVMWGPDSRHLIVVHDHSVLITLWALQYGTQMFIQNPKSGLCKFSDNDKYLCVIERRDCQDYIALFSTNTWQLVNHFKIGTIDAKGFQWMPNGLDICVWDHHFEHRIFVYSLGGTCLFEHEVANPISMGLQSVQWSPCGQYISAGTYDNMLYLINRTNWKVAGEMKFPSSVDGQEVQYYKETKTTLNTKTVSDRFALPEHKFEVVTDKKIDIKIANVAPEVKNSNKNAKEKKMTRYGVVDMKWSHDSSHLAVLNASCITLATVWNIATRSVTAVLELSSPVRALSWHPHLLRLIVTAGSPSINMWEHDGSWVIQLPQECSVNVGNITWCKDGSALSLTSREDFCIGFLENYADEEDEGSEQGYPAPLEDNEGFPAPLEYNEGFPAPLEYNEGFPAQLKEHVYTAPEETRCSSPLEDNAYSALDRSEEYVMEINGFVVPDEVGQDNGAQAVN